MNAKETMKKAMGKTKEWCGEHPKAMQFAKAMLVGALKQAAGEPEPAAPISVKENAVLGAKQVEAIQSMSSWQLSRIFKGKNATFASDPETLKAVSRLSSCQIDAVLGNEDL